MAVKWLVRSARAGLDAGGPSAAKGVLLAMAVAAAAIAVVVGSASSTLGHRFRARAAGAGATRYSLVHGCYALRSRPGGDPIGGGQGPFTMQAAALGIYLLYGPHGDYLTDAGGGTIQAASAPSAAAEWRVDGSSAQGFTVTNLATGTQKAVTFVPATGCAAYPEAEVDATGTPFVGASPEATVQGTVEGHAHVTAFEFFGGDWHCGRPWSPFGAPYALPADCSADQQGSNGAVEEAIDFGGPRPSDMHGWPTFREWPSPTSLAEEGDYYTGIERAWKAGLRLMVTNLVDNEALCGVMTTRHNPCNDMDAVRIQSRDLYALQDYIDAQSGGPGQGWFRIVTDPFQARRVISQGKLAVIEGIEVSRIFGCGEQSDVPQCDEAQIDAGLKEVHDLGVRTFFPVHEFDNAFGGTKMIGGEQGVIVNAGNREETGSFWTVQPCPAEVQDAPQVSDPNEGAPAELINGPVATLLHGSPLPVYPPGPHCNVRGLTPLGAYVINQMIKQHVLIQTDHMDSKTASAALAIAESQRYAGIVSAHCCSSPQLFARIYKVGGFVNPPVTSALAAVAQEKLDKGQASPGYAFGFGWGSDLNGLGSQPGPDPTHPISYPFKSYLGDMTFTREIWGERTFDLNTDGLANYGLYADWLRQVQLVGGSPVMADMFNGAEAYLEMWERAVGVPVTSCRPASESFSSTGLGPALQLGDGPEAALRRAGQPSSRPGRTYRYCVSGTAAGAVVSVFTQAGSVGLIGSTAPGDDAGGIRPGASARGLGPSVHRRRHGHHRRHAHRRRHGHRRRHRLGRARSPLAGVFIGPRLPGGARYAYGVAGGRVSFVAVAAASELASPARLNADLQAAGLQPLLGQGQQAG